MKKKHITLFLIFIVKVNLGQIVNIPDSLFKSYLLADTNINTNQDGEIQVSEAAIYSGTINVRNNVALTSGILDLTGIEAFTSLTGLICTNNDLGNLNISNNVALNFLAAVCCNLNNLDISNNINLDSLECGCNNLSSLDLLNNPALTFLHCSGNNLNSLNLSNNTALTHLMCFHNYSLTTLDLSSNNALVFLACNYCSLSSLDVRNGNNIAMANNFLISDNPDLFCVNVDDPTWSANNWNLIDTQTSFSSNCCSNLKISFDSINHATCNNPGYISAHATDGVLPYLYSWNTTPVDMDSSITTNIGGFYVLTVDDDSSCSRTKGVLLNAPPQFIVNGFDLNTNLIAGDFRPGRTVSPHLHAFNDMCTSVSGQVKVLIRGQASFDSATVTPDLIRNDTLIWNFTNWDYDSLGLLTNLYINVDTFASIGERICFEVIITPIAGDEDTTNNHKLYCFDVVNSYDPNDKQVYPAGVCTENYTLKEEKLEYTIRFQNTGNADAIDIYILDTLDANLDINTMRLLSVSHEPMITEILEDSIIKFRFDSIHLPDSFANEEASHGYVTYEISPNTGLPDGTEITNHAAIYFDFNPPIITNSTMNTMVSTIPSPAITVLNEVLTTGGFMLNGQTYTNAGTYYQHFYAADGCDSTVQLNLSNVTGLNENTLGKVSVYPSPFYEYFNISLDSYKSGDVKITVFDLLGKQQFASTKVGAEGTINIDGRDLESGIYIVQIIDSNDIALSIKITKN